MRSIYKTQVSYQMLVLYLVLICGILLIIVNFDHSFINFLLPCFLPVVILYYQGFKSYYELDDQVLYIRGGEGYKADLPVKDITHICAHNRWFSFSRSISNSPMACTFKRIKLTMVNGEEILLAPREKEDFIESLRNLNPGILVSG